MCFEGLARLSRPVWRRFVRGSRKISLVSSLHRASTDALIGSRAELQRWKTNKESLGTSNYLPTDLVWHSRPSRKVATPSRKRRRGPSINDLCRITEIRLSLIRLQNSQLETFLAYVTSRYRGMYKISTTRTTRSRS